MRVTTSEKNSCATLAYSGLRNAKSTEKLSHVLLGLGPGVICHTDSRWWKRAESATVLLTLWGGWSVTLLVYLGAKQAPAAAESAAAFLRQSCVGHCWLRVQANCTSHTW